MLRIDETECYKFLIYVPVFTILDFIVDVSYTTGIVLDPRYTGKAAKGLSYEMKTNPGRFKGKDILFIHTGKFVLNIPLQRMCD